MAFARLVDSFQSNEVRITEHFLLETCFPFSTSYYSNCYFSSLCYVIRMQHTAKIFSLFLALDEK